MDNLLIYRNAGIGGETPITYSVVITGTDCSITINQFFTFLINFVSTNSRFGKTDQPVENHRSNLARLPHPTDLLETLYRYCRVS